MDKNIEAPLKLNEFRGNPGGSLNHRTSFTFDGSRELVDNGSIVNAVVLDPATLAITPYTAVPAALQRRTQINPRMDYQINSNNTLTVRYMFLGKDIREASTISKDTRRGRTYRERGIQQLASPACGLSTNPNGSRQ